MIYALPPKSAKISPQMALSRLKYEYIKSELREPRLIIMHPTDAELYMEAKQKKLTGSKCGIKELLIFDDLQIVRTEPLKELHKLWRINGEIFIRRRNVAFVHNEWVLAKLPNRKLN